MKVIKNTQIFPKQIQCIKKSFSNSTRGLPRTKACGSILEIERSDVKRMQWIDIALGEKGLEYIVKCPICGNIIVIDSVENNI